MKRYACIACDIHTAKRDEPVECNEKTPPENAPDWCPLRITKENPFPKGWKGWIVPLLLLVLTLTFVTDYRTYRITSGSLPINGASGEYVRGWGYVPFTWDGHVTGTIVFSRSGKTGGVSLTLDGEHYTSDKEIGNKFEVVSASGTTVIRGNLTVVRYGELETYSRVTGKKQIDYKITVDDVTKGLADNGVDSITDEHRTMVLTMSAFEIKAWVDTQLANGIWFWSIRDVMAVSAYCQQHPQWEDIVTKYNTGKILNVLAILEYEVIDKDGNVLGSYIRPIRKANWMFCRDTWNWQL